MGDNIVTSSVGTILMLANVALMPGKEMLISRQFPLSQYVEEGFYQGFPDQISVTF